MPVILEKDEEGTSSYPTLFGFDTKNGFASKSLNFIYIVVMIVAIAFAYHALGLILTGWNVGLIFLAALSVVGLPYCIKIIMYGRSTFEYKHAVLCILISLLPTIFDFVGFYSETSIKSALQKTKFEVLETVNYFDKEARKSINKEILLAESTAVKDITIIEQGFNSQLRELNDKINEVETDIEKSHVSKIKDLTSKVNFAQQAIVDETQGVRGKSTSGVPGIGPRAIELEADLRKTQAAVDIERAELEKNKQKEIDKLKESIELQKVELEKNKQKEINLINTERDKKIDNLKQGLVAIDNLMSVNNDGDGLIFQVNKAKTFDELADTSIKVNNAINVVSSKLSVEPKYIKFETDNVINLSFSALIRGDITALVCFCLALLLEVVDTIIVYMVRGVKNNPKKKFEEPINKLKERIHYNF
jgi:hypothetical protein